VWQDPADLEAWGPIGPTGQVPSPAEAAEPAVPPPTGRLLALLPPRTRVIPDQTASLTVRTAAGTGDLGARLLDTADPLAVEIYRQRSGRAPTGGTRSP
jgi:hypothetical protein